MALVGRDEELGLVSGLLRGLAAGRGGALAVVGDPGMGKSALLQAAVASARGVTVLQVTGVDAEQRVAFAALGVLTSPLRATLAAAPGGPAAALRNALALGPPVTADRFAAYAGLLGLLTAAAAERPLVVAVDDAHWLDAPTSEALGFCLRRLGDDPVAFLVATRPPVPGWILDAGIPVRELPPLPADAAGALLDASGVALAPAVRDRVVALGQGNPLALRELLRGLDAEQRAGRRPLGDAGLTAPVADSFGRTLDALPAHTRDALLLVALEAEGRAAVVSAALRATGSSDADLAPAREADVLEADGPAFRHPLLRDVVRTRATAAERRAAHRILASVLSAPSDAAARAAHLAAAAIGPDEEAAAALDAAAGEAMSRTAFSVAADLLESAAALTDAAEGRAPRLLRAGLAAFAAGAPARALRALDAALEAVSDPSLRGRIAHVRGVTGLMVEPLEDVLAFMTREADRAREADPATAAAIMAEAVFTRMMAGRCDEAVALARRARDLLPPGVEVPAVSAFLAAAETLVGEVAAADAVLAGFPSAAPGARGAEEAGHMVAVASLALAWRGRLGEARAPLDAWIAGARESGAAGMLGLTLAYSAEVHQRMGRWDEARADAEEALALLGETGQVGAVGYASAILALVEAGRGDAAGVEAHLERTTPMIAAGYESLRTYAAAARGLLALGTRRTADAIAVLEPLVPFTAGHGLRNPAVVIWLPDLVEAYAHERRPDDARAVLTRLSAEAALTGDAWALAATARCRGLLAEAEDVDACFTEALAHHEGVDMPFERARTELAYGERLRRAGRRVEARRHLVAALAVFERLRADPWAAQARGELAASGEQRRAPADAHPVLTARELQVALAVAEGLRNREVAARLFLSEKTVERHLSQVYSKLGVRSRAELVRRLAVA